MKKGWVKNHHHLRFGIIKLKDHLDNLWMAIRQQIHQEIADVVRISEARDCAWKGKGAMWGLGRQKSLHDR